MQNKLLTAAIAKLVPSQPNNKNQDPNKCGGRGPREPKQLTKLCNMGEYCHTYGFHPISVNHNSKTCEFKQKVKHQNNVTYGNPTGLCPSVLPSNSRTPWHGRARASANDRDRG